MEQKFYICKHCGNIIAKVGDRCNDGGCKMKVVIVGGVAGGASAARKRFYLPKCVNTRIFSLTQSKRPQKHYISEVFQHFG